MPVTEYNNFFQSWKEEKTKSNFKDNLAFYAICAIINIVFSIMRSPQLTWHMLDTGIYRHYVPTKKPVHFIWAGFFVVLFIFPLWI